MYDNPVFDKVSAALETPASRLAFAAGTLFLAYWVYTVAAALLSPLRSIPGPFLARFTRLWYFKEVWTSKFHRTDLDLHKKYGTYTFLT
jgi:hypothetical protein